jgi:hypothetical protein
LQIILRVSIEGMLVDRSSVYFKLEVDPDGSVIFAPTASLMVLAAFKMVANRITPIVANSAYAV